MPRYVCIHGHFYQPPRENPWLEAIEVQDSAYPYHDWNERIDVECYAANAASRILDERERIVAIVNNYARLSFDFGPTLLSWMQTESPDAYVAVLAADRESRETFSGHGSALAHVYNHVILPLSNGRDKRTQIVWGIRDFETRFGRTPEGMWLPETAVDLESLEVLAAAGIRFTVLAPHQAARERAIGEVAWKDVAPGEIDTTRAYRLGLPSGASIAVFFYDGPVSRDVAFGGLLHSGERFASRLLGRFPPEDAIPRLVHIATDGETYGHHHPHGDMALAYALRAIGDSDGVHLTNYGEFLERYPPAREVEIHEDTSWSCAHGLGRWMSDCGCATGSHPGWSQAWRAPLRAALRNLRDRVAGPFEETGAEIFNDPWAARDAYVSVVLDRSRESVAGFLAAQARRPLSAEETARAIKLLELQRHAMLMETSCGWFFDDLAGIEAIQVLRYAGRGVQLAEELFGLPFEPQVLEDLEKARSNRREEGDGRRIWERHVRPARVDPLDVAGHYAVRSLFEPYAEVARIYCYRVERDDYRVAESGPLKVGVGRGTFTSEITGESERLLFGALHLGDHNVRGGVRRLPAAEEAERLTEEVFHAFSRADVPELVGLLDREFGEQVSLKTLFRDEQRRILRSILEETREKAEKALRQIHERHLPLLRFLGDLGTPAPRVFRTTAEFVLNAGLRRALERERLDASGIAALLDEAAREKILLDSETLEYLLRRRLEGFAQRFRERPEDLEPLDTLARAIALAARFPFPVRLWRVQNAYWRELIGAYPRRAAAAEAGDPDAQAWVESFRSLGERLAVSLP
jgi:alpha-amylase/alpha-mannosidase (GH57 family)